MAEATDHDQLFKDVIREFFPDFLRLFVSRYAAKYDFDTVRWLDKELFADPPDGPVHVLDMVAELRATEPVTDAAGPDPTTWLALVHIEIESPDSTTSIESRLPNYYHHLRAKYDKPVLPVVLYLKVGLDGLGVREIVDRYFDLDVRTMRYLYVGLPALSAADYRTGDNWLGVALSVLMRVPTGTRVEVGIDVMTRLETAPLSDRQKSLLGDCVESYIDIPAEDSKRFRDILEGNATGRVKPVNKTRVQIGREEGQLMTRRAAVLELLEARFGAVPADLADRVNATEDLEMLRQWHRTAATIPDLDAFLVAISS